MFNRVEISLPEEMSWDTVDAARYRSFFLMALIGAELRK